MYSELLLGWRDLCFLLAAIFRILVFSPCFFHLLPRHSLCDLLSFLFLKLLIGTSIYISTFFWLSLRRRLLRCLFNNSHSQLLRKLRHRLRWPLFLLPHFSYFVFILHNINLFLGLALYELIIINIIVIERLILVCRWFFLAISRCFCFFGLSRLLIARAGGLCFGLQHSLFHLLLKL